MTDLDKHERIIARLTELGVVIGKDAGSSRRVEMLADRLHWLDEGLFAEVCARLEDTAKFYPSLSEILAEVYHLMIERGQAEDPEHAWQRAIRESGRWQPVTRPAVAYSNPVTALCVQRLGGPMTIRRADERGIQILEREFRELYPVLAMSREQLRFVAEHGAWAQPLPPAPLELPPGTEVEGEAQERLAEYRSQALPEGTLRLALPAEAVEEG